ncbi:MAG: FecR family protein [Thermodesulfobacteriota bacterium]
MMNIQKGKLTAICGMVLMAAVLAFAWPPMAASARSVLPEGVVVKDIFTPGYGAPIGEIQRVRGEVVAVHAHAANQGYRVRPGTMLYKGDILYTMKKGKVRFRMNDGSILSLASETKLELNKSVYNKKKKSRSSFLNMAFGKARFLVVKLINFKRSEFKVKTPTAVCGVRGSDYIIETSGQKSIFIALKATTIEVASLKDPKAKPVVLNENQMCEVKIGRYPTDPVTLTPEQIQRVKEPFISVDPDDAEPEEGEVQGEAGTESDAKTIAMSDVKVLVPEDVIIRLPEDFKMRDPDGNDIRESVEQSGALDEKPINTRTDIIQQVREGILSNLPDFPQTP